MLASLPFLANQASISFTRLLDVLPILIIKYSAYVGCRFSIAIVPVKKLQIFPFHYVLVTRTYSGSQINKVHQVSEGNEVKTL